MTFGRERDMTALQPFGDTAEALKFDVLTDIRAELAESPTWDERIVSHLMV